MSKEGLKAQKNKFSISSILKGQSAIEYLMTYGWMLLVVAVVGGAIFSVVQQQSVESVSGFTGADVQVDDFGATQGGNLQMVLRNGNSESVEVTSINISSEEGDYSEWIGKKELEVTDTGRVNLYGITEGDNVGTLEVTLNYDSGGLSNLESSGTISGSFELKQGSMTTLAKEPEDLQQVFNEMNGDGSSSDPYEISDVYELQAIEEDLDSNYEVVGDINAIGTENWNDGRGFDPVGTSSNFTGSLEGNNHDIDGMYIDRVESNAVGMLNQTLQSEIKNLRVTNAFIRGNTSVGVLVGVNDGNVSNASVEGVLGSQGGSGGGLAGVHEEGLINDTYAEVAVTGVDEVGGLIGTNLENGTIKNSYALGDVDGETNTGGLIGRRWTDTNLTSVYAKGDVSGTNNVGGLIGFTYWSPPIRSSYATGDVSGDYRVGGLIGDQRDPQTYYSYATGDVSGISQVGGLVGFNRGNGDIFESFAVGTVEGSGEQVGGIAGRSNWQSMVKDSYALGNVNAESADRVGGLVGYANQGAEINRSYSVGEVKGNNSVGGLIGENTAESDQSYWDVPASEIGSSDGGTGLGQLSDEPPANEMTGDEAENNMNGLEFGDVWKASNGEYPVLTAIEDEIQLEVRQ